MIDEVYNRLNCNELEESEIESSKGDDKEIVMICAEDDEDSEINFKTRDDPSSPHPVPVNDKVVSPGKKSSSPPEISTPLYSDKISPKSPKKYRRSSLMAKLLENGDSDTEEEKEAEKTKLKTRKSPKEAKRNLTETPTSIITKKVGESPRETKKRVSFASDVEVKAASEVAPAESTESPPPPDEAAGDPEHGLLEVVWAKIGGHPWWPAIVCNDPDLQIFTRTKRRQGNKLAREMNVSFFGENTRAWVVSSNNVGSDLSLNLFIQDEKNLRSFHGLEEFEQFRSQALNASSKGSKQKLMKAFNPTNVMKEKWLASVKGKR